MHAFVNCYITKRLSFDSIIVVRTVLFVVAGIVYTFLYTIVILSIGATPIV